MSFAIAKITNASEDGSVPIDAHGRPTAWCGYCGNEGVVMLEGTIQVAGREYSRGSAPCPWCDQGELRMAGWTSPNAVHKGTSHSGSKHVNHHRRVDAATEITMYDVQETAAEPRRGEAFQPSSEWLLEREAAGCKRAALQGMFNRRIWPPEWTDDTGAVVVAGMAEQSVAEKKRQAQLELNRIQREEQS